MQLTTCSLLRLPQGTSPKVNISHSTTAKLQTSEAEVNIPLSSDSGASHLIGKHSDVSITHSVCVSFSTFDKPKSLIFTYKEVFNKKKINSENK